MNSSDLEGIVGTARSHPGALSWNRANESDHAGPSGPSVCVQINKQQDGGDMRREGKERWRRATGEMDQQVTELGRAWLLPLGLEQHSEPGSQVRMLKRKREIGVREVEIEREGERGSVHQED